MLSYYYYIPHDTLGRNTEIGDRQKTFSGDRDGTPERDRVSGDDC